MFILVQSFSLFVGKIALMANVLSFFLLILARSNFDHYARECNFGILKKKQKQNKKTKTKQKNCGIVRGKKEFFRASLYVWYLQYWALCDDLVDFKLRAGVRYLSFSIDTAPECILWKRSREDWSLRASRDGHSSSSSISPTLLVLRHLLQVQRAAVLWTFSIWLIWSFE